MKFPPGLTPPSSNHVCRLLKSLYVWKQASHQWYARLSSTLSTRGFYCSLSDYFFFFKITGNLVTILAVYVDDILITRNNIKVICEIKCFLYSEFKIKDLGEAYYILGMELVPGNPGMIITQRKFALEILTDFDLLECRAVSTPLDPTLMLSSTFGKTLTNPTFNRRLLGKMIFLTNTSPHFAYTVQHLSQYMKNPCSSHLQASYHALKYLSTDPCFRISYLQILLSRFKSFATPIGRHVLIRDDM